MGKCILILDDDTAFRELLVRLLEPTGYEIIEAGSTAEALTAAAKSELVLAIVDFGLPDTNGATFIARLREEGRNTPVVFVSATLFDQEMFIWLRNILHVSLMLQKPIDPTLFLQQIDSLLPAERPHPAPISENIGKREYESLVHASSAELRDSHPAPEILDSGTWKIVRETDPLHQQQMQEMHDKAASENAVKAAQRELAGELPEDWEKLSKRVVQLRNNINDAHARHMAVSKANKLRGTAGSLGLTKASEAAGKIEDYIKLLDVNDPLSMEILWLEIFRAMADGESEVRTLAPQRAEPTEENPVQLGDVLLLAGENTLKKDSYHDKRTVEAKVSFSASPVQAALSAASTKFDAAVLDIAAFGKAAMFGLARELRMTDLNEGLPLAFVMPPDMVLEDHERIFYGASATMTAPVEMRQLEECLRKLAGVNELKKVRILAVDDDPVLTRFLEQVLSVHGMSVSTLNDGIRILEAMEKLQPDIILLDVIMPGLSGYDICRMLRASERWCDVPIIFLTSKSDAQGRAAAFQSGANDFLSKPVLSEELVARVQMQLQRAQFGRQRASADKVTGLFTEQAFMDRAADMCLNAGRTHDSMTLCLVQIHEFEKLESYGLFSSITVLSAISNLLQCRFASETLRARWGESGFALAFQSESSTTVREAAQLLVKEIEQIVFSGDNGVTFSVPVRAVACSVPEDALSFKALVDTTAGRMRAARAKP